jgi:hypothetical protein
MWAANVLTSLRRKLASRAMNKALLVALATVVAVTIGCGRSKTYETPGGKVTVDQKGDSAKYEVQTKDGKATVTTAASDKGVSIPTTFPKDVPILKGSVPKMSMTQGKTEMLHLQVPGTIEDVAKEYQDKLKAEGWEIENTMNMGESAMVLAKKGNRKCSAVVMKDGNASMVQLSVSED